MVGWGEVGGGVLNELYSYLVPSIPQLREEDLIYRFGIFIFLMCSLCGEKKHSEANEFKPPALGCGFSSKRC